MPKKMIYLTGGGPVDGFPLVCSEAPEELHVPYTDEMVQLAGCKMTAESLDYRSPIDERRLEASRGVAIYTRQEAEAASATPAGLACLGSPMVTYVFRESVTPNEYRKRAVDERC
jgi:hypothetical protein